MSYACIDQGEVRRRGLCEGVTCASPSLVRELVVEPLLEPIFDDTPFSSSPVPWGGGNRWFGGGHRPRPRHRRGPRPSFNSGANTVTSLPGRRVGGTIDRTPKDDFPRKPAPSTAIAYRSPSPSSYVPAPGQRTVRSTSSMAPSQYQASPTTYTARPTPVGAPRPAYSAAPRTVAAPTWRPQPQAAYRASGPPAKSLKGLGQLLSGAGSRWKYAALGLGALVVAQFFWWNAKAPQVLRLGGY